MGTEDNCDMGLQHGSGDSFLNCPSSSGADPFFGSGLDLLVSLSQRENFGGSSVIPHNELGNSPYSVIMENQEMPNTSHLVQYPSDCGLVEMIPKLRCFGSGRFSEMVSSFGLPECGQISQGEQQISEGGTMGTTPSGKRKKRESESNFPFNPRKNGEGEQHMDISGDSSEYPKAWDEKKQKIEQNISAQLRGKQTGKQAKDNSNSGEEPKENYIHVRARRGQAMNSHSLAERVRRERISERMKLLQELVPGCDKITGKAVMLDEIINYVQSLQQQVEFLSMKLATVNPERTIDIESIPSIEILQSRGSVAAIPMSSSHPYPPGIQQGALSGVLSTSPFHSTPQNVWDNELQSLLQLGFSSGPAISNLGPNAGWSKLEL